MFSLLYNPLKMRIIVFSLLRMSLLYLLKSGSSSMGPDVFLVQLKTQQTKLG